MNLKDNHKEAVFTFSATLVQLSQQDTCKQEPSSNSASWGEASKVGERGKEDQTKQKKTNSAKKRKDNISATASLHMLVPALPQLLEANWVNCIVCISDCCDSVPSIPKCMTVSNTLI